MHLAEHSFLFVLHLLKHHLSPLQPVLHFDIVASIAIINTSIVTADSKSNSRAEHGNNYGDYKLFHNFFLFLSEQWLMARIVSFTQLISF